MTDKIAIIVDEIFSDNNDIERGARADIKKFIQNKSEKIFNLELSSLTNNIEATIQKLSQSLSKIDISNSPFEFDSISFTLAITSTGEIALLSSFKGSVSPKTGITFTLKPKAKSFGKK